MKGREMASISPVTGRPWSDNVVRQRQLQAANPDVEIGFKADPGSALWGTWTGVIIIGGERQVFTARDLVSLLGKLRPLAEERGQELGRLRLAWGDNYEDIRVDEHGRWGGRRRDGDGRELDAATADELNAAFRADQERDVTW